MASRDERRDDQIKEEVTRRTSSVITLAAITGLVVCAFINAAYGERSVPDLVFYIFAAVLVPDAIKFFMERR